MHYDAMVPILQCQCTRDLGPLRGTRLERDQLGSIQGYFLVYLGSCDRSRYGLEMGPKDHVESGFAKAGTVLAWKGVWACPADQGFELQVLCNFPSRLACSSRHFRPTVLVTSSTRRITLRLARKGWPHDFRLEGRGATQF